MRSLFLSLIIATFTANAQQTNILIDANLHHLGEKEVKTFPTPNQKPENPRLDFTFEAKQNLTEWTLRLDQRDVSDEWAIELNGQRIARLSIIVPGTTSYFSVAPGSLVEGTNKLAIVPSNPADDILVGKLELIPKPLRDVRQLAHVIVIVTGDEANKPTPARITIANREKIFADVYNVTPASAAWRNGIIYSGEHPVEFDVPQGDWIISATRGMEWSHPSAPVRLFIGQSVPVTLKLQRQVDTTGYIAADTHLHTYTYSRHGDASVDERVLSLAGEGVEFAVATDHNHVTDYKPRQAALGLTSYFTRVPGNEVTTTNGHFNAFPFKLDAKTPSTKETNWVRLVENIRAAGAQYVILNHPRWPTITNSPFAYWGLNRADGSRTNAMQYTVDAMEVINSTVPLKDGAYMLRDWFALWNRGEHLWGVGSSDTHTIHDVAGQGRTYIPSATDDPAGINVDSIIKEMQVGNMSVSYGIFGHATVNGSVKMGQIAKPSETTIEVLFHVAAPNWISPTQAVVYLNGVKVAETNLVKGTGLSLDRDLKFKVPAPAHDAHLICVAYGQGLDDPAWPTYAKYTLAVTNPIFIDADKDGKYRSPRETALALIDKLAPLSARSVESALDDVDPAIGVQLLSEAKLRLPATQLDAWAVIVRKAALRNELFALYADSTAAPAAP
jgi:hypothetical protein